ncbi:MAG: hypothetical protein JWN44_2107 [Myxococcales bacterium]|nr:hypothetical protein [Myxococcales bacterium]
MTPPLPLARRNSANTHAAFALHQFAAMRFAAVLIAVLAVSTAARAQTPTTMSGSCTGMMAGSVGLAVPSGTSFVTIPNSQITTGVFGAAECQCASAPGNPNINLEIKLTTPFPASQVATAEIWVGDSSCTNATTRTSNSNTTCQKIASPSVQDFTINSSAGSVSGLHYPILANALTSPFTNSCDPATKQQSSNSVYVFVYTDVNNPLATCQLTLSERLQGPDAVTNPSASSGDGALTLNWTAVPTGTYSPSYYQILCSDDCGNPITDTPDTQIYSVCQNGVLSRRDLTTGGSTTTDTDGGVVTTPADMALAMAAHIDSSRLPVFANVTACDADGGTAAHSPGGVFGGGTSGPLAALDPRYICSNQISPSSSSTRVGGLTNGVPYHFIILSVDAYGNATPTPTVDGTPQPTEDLWRRYRASGGQGGCFIATAAFGSYESGWVQVLRDFRDEVLLDHDWGKRFVEWYYEHSPGAASWIAERSWARALTRLALLPAIVVAWLWLYVPPWEKAFALTLLVAFILRKRIAARLRRGNAA